LEEEVVGLAVQGRTALVLTRTVLTSARTCSQCSSPVSRDVLSTRLRRVGRGVSVPIAAVTLTQPGCRAVEGLVGFAVTGATLLTARQRFGRSFCSGERGADPRSRVTARTPGGRLRYTTPASIDRVVAGGRFVAWREYAPTLNPRVVGGISVKPVLVVADLERGRVVRRLRPRAPVDALAVSSAGAVAFTTTGPYDYGCRTQTARAFVIARGTASPRPIDATLGSSTLAFSGDTLVVPAAGCEATTLTAIDPDGRSRALLESGAALGAPLSADGTHVVFARGGPRRAPSEIVRVSAAG